MAYRVVYLAALYKIPLELVVNTNQTGMHLVPTDESQTWEKRGAKNIEVLGIEDKRQITIISSIASGELLPLCGMYIIIWKGRCSIKRKN
jgi:hypothetical protein